MSVNRLQAHDPVGTSFSWDEAKHYYGSASLEDCLYMLKFVEMIIFHSLILLMSSRRPVDRVDYAIHKREFDNLVRTEYLDEVDFDESAEPGNSQKMEVDEEDDSDSANEESVQKETAQDSKKSIKKRELEKRKLLKDLGVTLLLPPFFCLDLLFKYRLYDIACQFLFYRGEHQELLELIRWEYEGQRDSCQKIKKKIAASSEVGRRELDGELDRQRKQRDRWFRWHVDYMQRINELAPNSTEKEIHEAEESCERRSGWVFKENETAWVECFRKWSNSDAKLKLAEQAAASHAPYASLREY